MNVIFLDFDGVINTIHNNTKENIEKRIKTLSNICKKYDAKVVIEASAKDAIDEDTLETEEEWIKDIFACFKKYNIECIGKTPNVIRRLTKTAYIPMWKEDEIRLYLYRHPLIDHYCVIDDNDYKDLEKVKDHLVQTIYYSDNYEEEGLLDKYIDEVGNALKKDNEIKKLILKKENKK